MDVKIRMLTPLWTGGVDGKMDRIHETGIIGSMRWWYEAIVRGLGGTACDPSRHMCPDRKGHVCDACALFGTTGLKRSFRIDLPTVLNSEKNEQLNIWVNNNNRGWFLKRGILFGGLNGSIIPVRLFDWTKWENANHFLALVFGLISEWGGIGPRTQQGYGVAEISTVPMLEIDKAFEFVKENGNRENRKEGKIDVDLPSIDDFFFAKVRFSSEDTETTIKNNVTRIRENDEINWYNENKVVPLSPIIRYHIRNLIRQKFLSEMGSNSLVRWRLMGVMDARYHNSTDQGKIIANGWKCQECKESWSSKPSSKMHCGRKIREQKWYCETCRKTWDGYANLKYNTYKMERHKSLINVSHAYAVDSNLYEFRIWGWIPGDLPGGVRRDDVLKELARWLGVTDPNSRNWSAPSTGTNLGCSGIPLSQSQVLWMARKDDEDSEAFLKALLDSGGSS